MASPPLGTTHREAEQHVPHRVEVVVDNLGLQLGMFAGQDEQTDVRVRLTDIVNILQPLNIRY